MNDTGAKQQIVDKIKNSSNILVTVSTDPSVDELSAALGLTLMLNKMNKHATAVFSGAIPPAITFLDPEKTFENTVDSLRDFIIALDKEKADHLRYKVDGDVVKIFITPYRTTITGDDLEFSQGDYNVELVLALGVKNQDSLDSALAAHGRILHDATVATISVGDDKSELGSIGWREETASSLSEVLVGLSDSLKSGKALLDEQIATAYLTGIVAATDRFSNNRTSSRVMTVAAQLMGAGANQQLIASKLQDAHEIGPDSKPDSNDGGTTGGENSDGTVDLAEGESTKLKKSGGKKAVQTEEPKKDDGELDVPHEKRGDVDEVAEATAAEHQAEATKAAEEELAKQTNEAPAPVQGNAAKEAEKNLADQLAKTAPAATATPSVADLQADLAAANEDINEAASQAPSTTLPPTNGAAIVPSWNNTPEPAMGGTLNATTEQAAEDARRAAEDDRNRTILSHGEGYITDSGMPGYQSPLNSSTAPSEEPPIVDPFQNMTPPPRSNDTAPTAYVAPIQPPSQTLEELDSQNRAPHEEARAAVDAAFNEAPAPTPTVQQPMASAPASPFPEPQQQPAGGLPPLPPLPDFSTLPPLPQPGGASATPSGAVPPEKLEDIFGQTPAPAPTAPAPNDPGQFKIPGQS